MKNQAICCLYCPTQHCKTLSVQWKKESI